MQWQRRRHPLDVPTPVAVALSDFCRRAKAQSTAPVVRDALSLLDESDDFRVRELCDADPAATPLGPFAVVDIVMGSEAEVASQRESTGYYELARQLLADTPMPEREDDLRDAAGQPAPRETEERQLPPEPLLVDAEKAEREKKKAARAAANVQQRIAPVKRTQSPPPRAVTAPKDSGYRKRDLPKGRGRFTVVEAAARSIDELTRGNAKDELKLLIEQSGNRIALKKRLATNYTSKRGKALTSGDVEDAIDEQGLTQALQQAERAAILSALHQSRGAKSRTAQSLGLSQGELDRLITVNGMTKEANELRERFSREALSTRQLQSRLSLISRSAYLRDLGIEKKFKASIVRDLTELLERVINHQVSFQALIDAAAKAEGLKADQLEIAVVQLGLAERFREKLSKG